MTINSRHPRTQVDGKQDDVSKENGKDFDPAEDKTRQEFAQEADLNHMLERFGVGAVPQRPTHYGVEIDYSQDLQGAYRALSDAETARQGLPKELRDQFPTTDAFLQAAGSGLLERSYADYQARQQKQLEEEKRRKAEEELRRQPPTPEGAKTVAPKSDPPA